MTTQPARKSTGFFPRTTGISLVELLVGITLGVAVLGMVVKVFANSRQQFQVADSHARIQENARQAIQFLQDDIRMAGFVGPVQEYWNIQETGNNTHMLGSVTGECFTTATRQFRWANPFARFTTRLIPPRVFGKEDTRSQFEGCISSANYVAGTDVLSVHYAGTPGIATTSVGDSDEAFYLRSNLRGGVVFTCGMGMNGAAMAGIPAVCVQNAVGPGAMLGAPYNPAEFWAGAMATEPSPETSNYVLQSLAYYIRPCTDPGTDGNCGTADDGDSTPALVRARVDYNADSCVGDDPCVVHEPVAEGVVSMHVEYGVDTREASAVTPDLANRSGTADFYDGQVNQYVNAGDGLLDSGNFDRNTSFPLWSRVLTVRIWLLIRSPVLEPGYQGPTTYTLSDESVAVNSRFRHQLFTTTVTVRNLTAQ